MKSYLIIAYTSAFIWIILPLFYRGHKFFYFFLVLALMDGIGMVLLNLFSIPSQSIWMPFNYLLLFMLFRDKFLKYKLSALLGFLLITVMSFLLTDTQQVLFCTVIHIVIFMLFTKMFVSDFYLNNSFNFFFLLLIFYEIILVFKLLAFMREITVGIEVFFVGTLVQIFIGIALISRQIQSRFTKTAKL